MTIHFPLSSVPELRDVSPAIRRIAWHYCRAKTYRHWQTWAGLAVGLTAGAAAGVGLFQLIVWIHPFNRLATHFLAGFLAGGAVVGVTIVLRNLVMLNLIGPYAAEYLESMKNGAEAGKTDA